jgi:hypothetical protein
MADRTFLESRVAGIQAAIIAYEAAELALSTGGVQTYMLDTGQTRSTVTKLDLASIRKTITSLYNQYATLCARLNGGAVTVRPQW